MPSCTSCCMTGSSGGPNQQSVSSHSSARLCQAAHPALGVHGVDALLLHNLARALAQRLKAGVLRSLEEGGEGVVDQEVGGDEIRPALKVLIQKGQRVVQRARLRLDLDRIGLGLRELAEQGVERARVAQLVLRHGGSRDRRLQCGRAITPEGVTPPDGLLVIGQRRDDGEQRRVIDTCPGSSHKIFSWLREWPNDSMTLTMLWRGTSTISIQLNSS